MADGVAQNDGASAGADGCRVERNDGRRVGANGVLGNVHDGEPRCDGEGDSIFGDALKMIDGPILHEAANRAGAEKCGGFNGDANALGNFDDRGDIVLVCASGAVGADFHARSANFAGEGFGVGESAGACARKTDVHHFDSEGLHQVEDFNFLGDRGIANGRIL